jgi:peroxiredoxin
LQKVHQEAAKKGGLVLGVALKGDTVASLRQFRQRNKVNYPLAIDAHGRLGRHIEGIPFTIIVDRNGVIRHAHGYDPKAMPAQKAAFLKMLSSR